MALADDIAFVGQLLDAYAAEASRIGIPAEDPDDHGVPPEMQVGDVHEEGWVEWRMLPSTLGEADVLALEHEFTVQFPPMFRAYLLARLHLFRQVRSRRYDQQIGMPHTPAGKPLGPLRSLMTAWRPLIDAGFTPFAEWGDGWGPMCFDDGERGADGDCPVVWMDHEELIELGPQTCQNREAVLPKVKPLYRSCRQFLTDVFGGG